MMNSSPEQQNNNNQQQQPNKWTPQVVENLIYRQFLKGEDVTSSIPPPVFGSDATNKHNNNNNNNAASPTHHMMKLPELDPAIRALQKYCENGPSVPTNTARNPNNQNNMNYMMNTAANGGGATPSGKNRPPLAYNGQMMNNNNNMMNMNGQQQNPNFNNGAPGTPRVRNQQQNNNNKSMPRTPGVNSRTGSEARGGNNNNNENNNNNMVVDHTKRRRIEWPISVPNDNQLKGPSRSQLQPFTEKRIAAQAEVDPDLIFRQDTSVDFPLNQIFAKYPSALKVVAQARGLSGDWRTDTFSAEEEAQYKKDMGFTAVGPSQAVQQQNRGFGGALMNNNNNGGYQ